MRSRNRRAAGARNSLTTSDEGENKLAPMGRHPAALNYGDCFVYALARQTGEPLLSKGNDFPRTDIGMIR